MSANTRQREFEKRHGLKTKSFVLPAELIERFKDACQKAGVTQSAQIQYLMTKFIEETEKDRNEFDASL